MEREDGQGMLNHFLFNVAQEKEDSAIVHALEYEEITTLFELMDLGEEDVGRLICPGGDEDGNFKPIPLRKGQVGTIRSLRNFVRHLHNTHDFDLGKQWSSITAVEYNCFRTQGNAPPLTPVATQLMTPPFMPQYSPHKPTAAEYFRRNIKWDSSQFPVLKDEKLNDAWHHAFMAMARAQDVDVVLDHKYRPSTTEESDLFLEKQKFVYAVLQQKVLTTKGKSIILDHADTGNAQAAYHELSEHHLRSTKAMFDAASTLSWITSVRLGSGTWSGTNEAFLEHWRQQIKRYERQFPRSEHMSDTMKKIMLENAVHPIPELRQVKNNVDLQFVQTGETLGFEQYYSLLYNAAVALNHSFCPKKEKRVVLQHEQYQDPSIDDEGPDADDDGELLDDDYTHEIHAFAVPPCAPLLVQVQADHPVFSGCL
jgi:hypothetical protein